MKNMREQTKEERLNRTEIRTKRKAEAREQRRAYNLVRYNKQGKKGRW